jgi:hypothetical protein
MCKFIRVFDIQRKKHIELCMCILNFKFVGVKLC